MSFLSDLFGVTPNTKQANLRTRQLAAAYPRATAAATQPLQQGLQGTLGAYQQYLPQATGALTGGETSAIGALQQGQAQALPALTGGEAQAAAPYQALMGEYDPAASLYWGGLGAGGPGSEAAAAAAFQGSPWGQELQANLGTMGEAVARGAGTSGQTGQGYIDAARDALGLTQQAEQGWLGSLAPALQGQQFAAGGLSGVVGQFAPEIAGLYTGTGAGMADIYGRTAQELANVYGTGAAGTAGGYSAFDPLMSQINWQGAIGGPAALQQGAYTNLGLQQQANAMGLQGLMGLIQGGAKIASAGMGGAGAGVGGGGSVVGPGGSYGGDPFAMFG